MLVCKTSLGEFDSRIQFHFPEISEMECLLGVKVISSVSQTEEYGFESRRRYFGSVTQRLEWFSYKELAEGSNPSRSTIPRNFGEEDIPL